MEIYTIGFTKKAARDFFETLKGAGIRRLIDVRLNNRSQLAGFAKRDDLRYFLEVIAGIEYRHEPILSPTKDILDGYRKKQITWAEYESRLLALLADRDVQTALDRRLFDVPTVLLCTEPKPDHCHRRLVAEYLAAKWGGISVVHL